MRVDVGMQLKVCSVFLPLAPVSILFPRDLVFHAVATGRRFNAPCESKRASGPRHTGREQENQCRDGNSGDVGGEGSLSVVPLQHALDWKKQRQLGGTRIRITIRSGSDHDVDLMDQWQVIYLKVWD